MEITCKVLTINIEIQIEKLDGIRIKSGCEGWMTIKDYMSKYK